MENTGGISSLVGITCSYGITIAHDANSRQYLYAPQLDGCSSNSRFAVCGIGSALAQARDWMAGQSLMESEQMARMVLTAAVEQQRSGKDLFVLYRRQKDAPLDEYRRSQMDFKWI